jgi:hypothetical protein
MTPLTVLSLQVALLSSLALELPEASPNQRQKAKSEQKQNSNAPDRILLEKNSRKYRYTQRADYDTSSGNKNLAIVHTGK